MIDPGDRLVGNHAETAQLLRISEQALWKAVKERGCPSLGKFGRETRYDWREVFAWRIADLMPDDLDPARERARKDSEHADKLAMENAVRRGELAEVAQVERVWSDCIAIAKARLLGIGSKLGPQLVNIADATVISAAIRAEARAALVELADYAPDATDVDRSGATASGSAVAPAPRSDGESVGGRRASTQQRKQRRAGAVED